MAARTKLLPPNSAQPTLQLIKLQQHSHQVQPPMNSPITTRSQAGTSWASTTTSNLQPSTPTPNASLPSRTNLQDRPDTSLKIARGRGLPTSSPIIRGRATDRLIRKPGSPFHTGRLTAIPVLADTMSNRGLEWKAVKKAITFEMR
jgi:hypothetical protein